MSTPREVKVFEVSIPSPEETEYVEFIMRFVPADGGEPIDEAFRAFAKPGGGAELAMAALVRWDDGGRQIIDLNGVMTYFDRTMPPEDFTRLSDLIRRKDLRITIEAIGDVFQYLVETHTGRPLVRSSSSFAGRSSTGASSTATRSSAAST